MGTSKCLFSQVRALHCSPRGCSTCASPRAIQLCLSRPKGCSQRLGKFSHHFWISGGRLPVPLPELPVGSLQLGKMRRRNGRSTQPAKFTAGSSQVLDGLSWFFLFCTSSSTICAIPINSCEWFVCLILHAECWKSTLKLWKNNGESMYNWK